MTAIAVLGAGTIGATLARKWAATGHRVALGSRTPDASTLRDLAAGIGARTASHAGAVTDAEVVVVALPGASVSAVADALGQALDGKLVIDASNNLAGGPMNSIAVLTRHAPGAIAVRAFNSLGWENFANPDFDGTPPTCCGAAPTATPAHLSQRSSPTSASTRPRRRARPTPRRRHARLPLVRPRPRPRTRPLARLQDPQPLLDPPPASSRMLRTTRTSR